MYDYLAGKKIMVVVAHPDDELLGLGATLHRLSTEYRARVRIIILGEGLTSRSDERDRERWAAQLAVHRRNIDAARRAIAAESVGVYDFPDNRFDTVALLDLIKVVEKEKTTFDPTVIFTHHGGDVNIDHQRTFEAVITACRPMAHERVRTLLTFETPSGTEWRSPTDPRHFHPNVFFTVTEKDLAAKIEGMESYEFERRAFPHPRSPEALRIQAARWGVTVGAEYAEAFALVRLIG